MLKSRNSLIKVRVYVNKLFEPKYLLFTTPSYFKYYYQNILEIHVFLTHLLNFKLIKMTKIYNY